MDIIYVDCPECKFRYSVSVDPTNKETRYSCSHNCPCTMIILPIGLGVYEIRNAKDEVKSAPVYDSSDC